LSRNTVFGLHRLTLAAEPALAYSATV
jgi:hypothetical protein